MRHPGRDPQGRSGAGASGSPRQPPASHALATGDQLLSLLAEVVQLLQQGHVPPSSLIALRRPAACRGQRNPPPSHWENRT